jgi:hypothetical protein
MPILVSRSFASSAISTSSSSQRIVMICFISFASYGCRSIVSDPRVVSPRHRSFVQPPARPAALCHCGGMPARPAALCLAGWLAAQPQQTAAAASPLPTTVVLKPKTRPVPHGTWWPGWRGRQVSLRRAVRCPTGAVAPTLGQVAAVATPARIGATNGGLHRRLRHSWHRRRPCLRRDDHQPIKQVDRHAVRRLERRAYLGTHSQQRALWRRGAARSRHECLRAAGGVSQRQRRRGSHAAEHATPIL